MTKACVVARVGRSQDLRGKTGITSAELSISADQSWHSPIADFVSFPSLSKAINLGQTTAACVLYHTRLGYPYTDCPTDIPTMGLCCLECKTSSSGPSCISHAIQHIALRTFSHHHILRERVPPTLQPMQAPPTPLSMDYSLIQTIQDFTLGCGRRGRVTIDHTEDFHQIISYRNIFSDHDGE